MGHRAQADKTAIQNEYVPLMLEYIYKRLKKGGESEI
jgi:hypothetical protein